MNNAHWYAAWIFNSWRSFPTLALAATMVPWAIESLMVRDKQWIGPGGARGLRPSYELVALLCHDRFQIPNRGIPDVWREQGSSNRPSGHPAEKPLEFLKRILLESASKGLVLDLFAGSGTTLVAAKALRDL